MLTLVCLAFAMLFGVIAVREISRGYTYDRGGNRITRDNAPTLFWMFVTLELLGSALSAAIAISAALK
jgi:DMSO reductase anchor subunit